MRDETGLESGGRQRVVGLRRPLGRRALGCQASKRKGWGSGRGCGQGWLHRVQWRRHTVYRVTVEVLCVRSRCARRKRATGPDAPARAPAGTPAPARALSAANGCGQLAPAGCQQWNGMSPPRPGSPIPAPGQEVPGPIRYTVPDVQLAGRSAALNLRRCASATLHDLAGMLC